MSFATPVLLLGLLAVPLAAVAYVRHERARARAAAAVVNPALRAAVAPSAPGWRRHVPVALYGLALAALLVSLARPQATVAVPVERAGLVLALDTSGSMESRDVAPNRMTAARGAALQLLRTAPRGVRVGYVGFDHQPRTVLSPSTDRSVIRGALEAARPGGGTATGEAMLAALRMLQRAKVGGRTGAPGAIVLISDGTSTRGRDPRAVAEVARRSRLRVNTIALGTQTGTIRARQPGGSFATRRVPPDVAAMRDIARRTGGRATTVADADALTAVLDDLGSEVGTRDERREVTTRFAGGALVLFVLGAGASLGLTRRLPL